MKITVGSLTDWLDKFEYDNWVEIGENGLLVRNGPDDQDYRIAFDEDEPQFAPSIDKYSCDECGGQCPPLGPCMGKEANATPKD